MADAPHTVIFWFDFHSPWAYLAANRIDSVVAPYGYAIDWRPLHLANLIDAIGGRRPLEANPAFVRWYQQDLQDWAALQGVVIRHHPSFPLRPSRALRAALYAAERGRACCFVRGVMAAYWTLNRDISDVEVIADIAASCGLDPDAVRSATASNTYKRMLEQNNAAAIAAGVFGVPTMIARGKLFWGNDRLELLERSLAQDGHR
jgi:2-hydroxychromene-2-carboxylate isomerase